MIKKFFFGEEENAKSEQNEVSSVKKETNKPLSRPSSTSASSGVKLSSITPTLPIVNEGTASEKFLEYLKNVYNDANFPGPDFQEFEQALKEVENEPMDEKSKYNTIFIGFKVQGVTKAKLIDTAKKYLELLDKQVDSFNKEFEQTFNTSVGQKQKTVENLNAENEQIEVQMRQLAEKKSKNNDTMQKSNIEIAEETTRLNNEKASFEASAKAFAQNIVDKVNKIEQYVVEKPITSAK